jgi:hypothetical protein
MLEYKVSGIKQRPKVCAINKLMDVTNTPWQCVFLGTKQTPRFRDEIYGDVKMLGYNLQGHIVRGQNILGRTHGASRPTI